MKKRGVRSVVAFLGVLLAAAALAVGAAALPQAAGPQPASPQPASPQPASPQPASPQPASPQPASPGGGAPQDELGNLVVTPGAGRPLPKLGVVPSISADMADVLLHSVVQRDLDLSGEFELLPERVAPPGVYASDQDIALDEWGKKGAEVVVRVNATTAGDTATLATQAFLPKKGETPIFDWKSTAKTADLRGAAHRISDLLIGALTGQNGGFYSRMTFTSGQGSVRLAYVIDADGHDAHAVSPPDQLAIDSAFGPNGDVYWVSSVNEEPYEVRSGKGALSLPVRGPVYGLAFSRGRGQVALSIGVQDAIHVFLGPDFASIRQASPVPRAISPTFTPGGAVAYSGAGGHGQRIYVGDRPITPPGIFAGSPTFCNHPDGVIAVFAAGAGKVTDIVRTGEQGGPLFRLTQGQGSNGSPACSPDGRLVAFFSTRTTGEGPGLYVMRVDGRRPKRVSSLLGSTLEWAALPPPPALPAPVPGAAPEAR